MKRQEIHARRKYLRTENRNWPEWLTPVRRENWPTRDAEPRTEVWRSRTLLVQIFAESGVERISVNRTEIEDSGRFRDGLTWDDLMEVKRQCGRGSAWAVEIYPPDAETVNVSNMRHLFVLPNAPGYAWRKNR